MAITMWMTNVPWNAARLFSSQDQPSAVEYGKRPGLEWLRLMVPVSVNIILISLTTKEIIYHCKELAMLILEFFLVHDHLYFLKNFGTQYQQWAKPVIAWPKNMFLAVAVGPALRTLFSGYRGCSLYNCKHLSCFISGNFCFEVMGWKQLKAV
jgi:hypothetical protein